MTAFGDKERSRRTRYLADDSIDLGPGCILVVYTLDYQERRGDRGQVGFHIPIAEPGVSHVSAQAQKSVSVLSPW